MSEQDLPEQEIEEGAGDEASQPDLSAVFGPLDDARRAAVQEQLDAAGETLGGLAAALGERSGRAWTSSGAAIEVFDSGQAMVKGVVEDSSDGITFTVEARPSNFFDDERPWRPGEAPSGTIRLLSSCPALQ